MAEPDKKLHLRFHGRIIDSLGIQMYQSPVAAIAELIANAWDADASEVSVTLPANLGGGAEIVVRDNGNGMTFADCQERYLNVGRNRRLLEGNTTPGGRPFLARKGIGKFAGFGIAKIVEIETVSGDTGEHTAFRLDHDDLRSEEYVDWQSREIPLLANEGPDAAQRGRHGTTVRLRTLLLSKKPGADAFALSMARRFVLAQQAENFKVTVNGTLIPPDADPLGNKIEFIYPRDFKEDETPDGLITTGDGWARETLASGQMVEWQIKFAEKPIGEEEFRGVAVYCGVKLAQAPFFFLLSGGLAGQHGQQYMTGRVRADYLDHLAADIITTERQRVNWEQNDASKLLEWGQGRVKQLLSLWQERRADKKIQAMDERLAGFSKRLEKLNPTERKTVRRALSRIAGIAAIEQDQFETLANAILTAWEGGRLHEIIEQVSRMEQMDAGTLVTVLTEHQVLTALHVAEAVRLKVGIVDGLRRRISTRQLENDIRDYIAANPWLISPRWETFQIERRIDKLANDAAVESGIASESDWKGRVDLALSSGDQLLILEFMRPGLTVDRNHMERFQRYFDILKTRVTSNTGLKLRNVTGMLVADNLHQRPEDRLLLERMEQDGMLCQEWAVLLGQAEAQWKDFLFVLASRSPGDERIKGLATDTEGVEK